MSFKKFLRGPKIIFLTLIKRMQNIISSNQKSVTESQNTKDAVIPYYPKPESMPELGIQFQEVGPYITLSGAIANNSVTFKLPPGAGFMYEASLGWELFTPANLAAGDITCQLGITMIRQIDWLANGQPILSQTGHALRCLIKTLPFAEQEFHNKYSFPLKRTTEAPAEAADGPMLVGFLTYTPLIASWLTDVQKCLLLSAIGDLQLRVTFDTTVMTGFSQAISVAKCTLFVQTYMPKLSVYNQMVLNDWSKTLVMPCFNTFTEQVPLDSATGVSNYTLTVPFLVYRTHFFIRNIVAAPGTETTINTISVDIAGVKFINSYRKSRLVSLKARNGLASIDPLNSDVIAYDNIEYGVIDWGVHSTRDENMGTAFFQELRGSKIAVTCEAVIKDSNNLFIVHEFFNNISFTPGSGGSGSLAVAQNN